nr:hypothetical protein [Tanacetum cinerariifolium]
MLSVKAVRYIIRTSPCIGAVSVGKVSINFFISWCAAAACCVHSFTFEALAAMPCLVVRCLKTRPSLMPKVYFFRASFDNSRLLLLRQMLSCPRLLLPFKSDGSLYRHLGSTLDEILRETLPSNQSRVEVASSNGDYLFWVLAVDDYLLFSINSCVENKVPIPWVVWNLTAPWIVETTIPIFCIAVLPNSILYVEFELTMAKLRVSVPPTSLLKFIAFMMTDDEELLPFVTEGNVISLPLKLSAIVSVMSMVFVKIVKLGHVSRSSSSQHTRRLLEASGYLFSGDDLSWAFRKAREQSVVRSFPSNPCKWMESLWRGVRPSFLLSNHEQNQKYDDLHVDPKSTRCCIPNSESSDTLAFSLFNVVSCQVNFCKPLLMAKMRPELFL